MKSQSEFFNHDKNFKNLLITLMKCLIIINEKRFKNLLLLSIYKQDFALFSSFKSFQLNEVPFYKYSKYVILINLNLFRLVILTFINFNLNDKVKWRPYFNMEHNHQSNYNHAEKPLNKPLHNCTIIDSMFQLMKDKLYDSDLKVY